MATMWRRVLVSAPAGEGYARGRLTQSGLESPRRRWLEPRVRAGVADAALKAALDADDHTAAYRLLARRHWRATLSWAALSDAAGYFDLVGNKPWPGLVSAAATAEALHRRALWRYQKRERPGQQRFLWHLAPAGVIYLRLARERSDFHLARAIASQVDQEGMSDFCAIGLELLRERVRRRGMLSAAARKALASAFASQVPMIRELAFQVIAVAERSAI